MAFNPNPLFNWSRKEGYEVSSIGDRKFSAFYAKLSDGRTIEEAYQVGVKGYRTIREGKGKPPKGVFKQDSLWKAYLQLWKWWALENEEDIFELALLASTENYMLRDTFASTPINQARALSVVLNETFSIKQ